MGLRPRPEVKRETGHEDMRWFTQRTVEEAFLHHRHIMRSVWTLFSSPIGINIRTKDSRRSKRKSISQHGWCAESQPEE